MSAVAIATLQKLWEKLSFHTITRVIAREPEDVLFISIKYGPFTTEDGCVMYLNNQLTSDFKRWSDVPAGLRERAEVSYRHYYGFTSDNIMFRNDDYVELDLSIDLTCDFSRWGGNHTGGKFKRPRVGQTIAGTTEETPKGRRFKQWFVCSPELRVLIELVKQGHNNLSENELACRMMTNDYPDAYWAIARLVFFDNIQAFVDQCKPEEQNDHPCKGKRYGQYYGPKQMVINHTGMYLPKGNTAEYVHELSCRLNEPKWWEEFQRLAKEQGVEHDHPVYGGLCHACEAEKQKDPDYWLSRSYNFPNY
jgi:hypothetical protein